MQDDDHDENSLDEERRGRFNSITRTFTLLVFIPHGATDDDDMTMTIIYRKFPLVVAMMMTRIK
jgi:hypothetical protein